MTRMLREAAETLCGGRLVLVHEGGYSEAYVPFCGHAVIEELSGRQTAVVDPAVEFIELQQPKGRTAALFRDLVDRQASALEALRVPS
jgi:acetoin utilization deacetylase AcuC-like enzyme